MTGMKSWKRIKKEENVQAPEPEPEPQGLENEAERIPGIVEDMEKEDQDAQIMEQCGDSSDDERFPVLGEWREEGFGNPVVQDIRCPEFEYRVNEVIICVLSHGGPYRPPVGRQGYKLVNSEIENIFL